MKLKPTFFNSSQMASDEIDRILNTLPEDILSIVTQTANDIEIENSNAMHVDDRNDTNAELEQG